MLEQETPHPATPGLDVGILVLSCDKFADVWKPYFDAFFDQWPDCPFKLYLASNEIAYSDPRVISLLSGPDADWSSSILAALRQCPHKFVLTLLEDAFFLDPLDTAKITNLMDWAARNESKYLRIRGFPLPDESTCNPEIGRIHELALYRTAIFGVMWERIFFQSLLQPGESAWHFEINSPSRCTREAKLHSTFSDFIPVLHGIEKGYWIPSALEIMQNRGYVSMNQARPVMAERMVRSGHRKSKIKNFVKGLLHPRLRSWVHRALWNWFH